MNVKAGMTLHRFYANGKKDTGDTPNMEKKEKGGNLVRMSGAKVRRKR